MVCCWRICNKSRNHYLRSLPRHVWGSKSRRLLATFLKIQQFLLESEMFQIFYFFLHFLEYYAQPLNSRIGLKRSLSASLVLYRRFIDNKFCYFIDDILLYHHRLESLFLCLRTFVGWCRFWVDYNRPNRWLATAVRICVLLMWYDSISLSFLYQT